MGEKGWGGAERRSSKAVRAVAEGRQTGSERLLAVANAAGVGAWERERP